MKNEIEVFNNEEFGSVRTIIIENEIWFVGKDVASSLGYSDSYGALKKHVDDEDKQNCQNSSFETPRGMIIINESGLYSLILSSKLSSAKKFKHWVTSEVLPTLRKTGIYTMQNKPKETETTNQVAFEEMVKTLPVFADFLKVNDVSKLIMAKKLCEDYNVSTNFLPDYVKGGDRETKSATELLKQIGSNLSSIKFNQILLKNGYLEERTRPSRSSKTGIKLYKALTEKGLEYGQNLISPNNPKETQPSYYVDTFEKLYKGLGI